MISALKIKLSAKELPELIRMYNVYIGMWESDDYHELLLLEHATILADRLTRAQRPEAKKYTVKFNAAEALAFYLFWQMINTAGDILGNAIICRVVWEIDKESKQVKLLEYGQ